VAAIYYGKEKIQHHTGVKEICFIALRELHLSFLHPLQHFQLVAVFLMSHSFLWTWAVLFLFFTVMFRVFSLLSKVHE
jgi:hypothetical protein